MRLLTFDETDNLVFWSFYNDEPPPYAILSHTWHEDNSEEVTFKDMQLGRASTKPGFKKIEFCRTQAKKNGLQYFWIDTCCIDKDNGPEIAESIISMFRWYEQAERCYVYLSDVPTHTDDHPEQLSAETEAAVRKSRWFTRGWTLQELIAPTNVVFYGSDGEILGTKLSLVELICDVTGIAKEALIGRRLGDFDFEQKMSWIKDRTTKRKEDKIYSMLGIFGVSMPIIYGEGYKRALKRMRRELVESSEDESGKKQEDAHEDEDMDNLSTSKLLSLPSAHGSDLLDNSKAEESIKLLDNIKAEESTKLLDNIKAEESIKLLDNVKAEESSDLLHDIKAEESSDHLDNSKAEGNCEPLSSLSSNASYAQSGLKPADLHEDDENKDDESEDDENEDDENEDDGTEDDGNEDDLKFNDGTEAVLVSDNPARTELRNFDYIEAKGNNGTLVSARPSSGKSLKSRRMIFTLAILICVAILLIQVTWRKQQFDAKHPVFAIIGRTGVGKSSFIDLLGGRDERGAKPEVCHGLDPCTNITKLYTTTLNNTRIYLMDAPGFDDRELSDVDVIAMIYDEIQAVFHSGMQVNGLVYLQDINEARVGRLATLQFRAIEKLLGMSEFGHLVFVTTKWPTQASDDHYKQLQTREDEYRTQHWAKMHKYGAQIVRFNPHTRGRAELILYSLLNASPIHLKSRESILQMVRELYDEPTSTKRKTTDGKSHRRFSWPSFEDPITLISPLLKGFAVAVVIWLLSFCMFDAFKPSRPDLATRKSDRSRKPVKEERLPNKPLTSPSRENATISTPGEIPDLNSLSKIPDSNSFSNIPDPTPFNNIPDPNAFSKRPGPNPVSKIPDPNPLNQIPGTSSLYELPTTSYWPEVPTTSYLHDKSGTASSPEIPTRSSSLEASTTDTPSKRPIKSWLKRHMKI